MIFDAITKLADANIPAYLSDMIEYKEFIIDY